MKGMRSITFAQKNSLIQFCNKKLLFERPNHMQREKSSEAYKGLHRSISDSLIVIDARQNQLPEKITLESFLFKLKHKRTLFLLLFFSLNLIFMNICNVFAYKYMVTGPPLPDVISSNFPKVALLRKNEILNKIHITALPTLIFIIGSICVTYSAYNIANLRKPIFLLSISIFFRSIFFIVTQVPPPCSGYEPCNCVSISYQNITKSHSFGQIFFIYMTTFGLGTSKIPQCGDQMMSGYTLFQCALCFYILDTTKRIYSGKELILRKIFWGFLLTIASLFVILIRSQYSIGVVLSFSFFGIAWIMYSLMQYMYYIGYSKFTVTYIGRLFSLLEEEIISPNEASTF